MPIRVFDSRYGQGLNQQHFDGEIRGSVRIIVDESADP